MGIAEFLDAPDSALLVAINGEVELVTTKHVTSTRLIIDRFALGPVANIDAVLALLPHARPLSTTAPESVPALPSPAAERADDLLCPECGQLFTRKDTLVRHRKSHGRVSTARVVPPIEDLTCSECSQVFETIPGLLSHRRHVHAIAPAIVGVACHLCPRTFKNQHALDVHLARGHQVNGTWSTKPKAKADAVAPPKPSPVTQLAPEQPTPVSLDVAPVLGSPSPPAVASGIQASRRTYTAAKAPVADGVCPVCREPMVTHEQCDGCDVFIGPNHGTTHGTFISGGTYCRDCAEARIAARKAELVAA